MSLVKTCNSTAPGGPEPRRKLAERLEVPGQSVSKWESNTSFPEMEKLMTLCSLFQPTWTPWCGETLRRHARRTPSATTDT